MKKAKAPMVKLLVRGDGACGKTSLVYRYSQNAFTEEYIPTIWENSEATAMMNGQEFKVSLWDPLMREDGERLIALSYPQTDIFFLCFSVVSPTSLASIPRYVQHVRQYSQYAPRAMLFLIGLKSDLRDNSEVLAMLAAKNQALVPVADAEEMVRLQKLEAYYETSALTGKGVKEAFEAAVTAFATRAPELKKEGGCILL